MTTPRGLAGRFWADATGASPRWGRTIIYGVVVARLSLVPMLILVGLIDWAAHGDAPGPGSLEGFSGAIGQIDAVLILSALIFAPVLESLLVAFLTWLVGFRLKLPLWPTATLVGLAFVPLHGLVPASLVIAPFFILMAAVWYNWQQRNDGLGGYGVVMTMHAASNGLALVTTAILRGAAPDWVSTVIK